MCFSKIEKGKYWNEKRKEVKSICSFSFKVKKNERKVKNKKENERKSCYKNYQKILKGKEEKIKSLVFVVFLSSQCQEKKSREKRRKREENFFSVTMKRENIEEKRETN